MVLLLAGLPLLARPFLGPVGDSRAARFLRVGTCAALLALIPAQTSVAQFHTTPPRRGAELRVYRLIVSPPGNIPWAYQLISLIVMVGLATGLPGLRETRPGLRETRPGHRGVPARGRPA